MLKTIEDIKLEITNAQQTEFQYKGTINRGLYILCIDTLGKIARKTSWKNLDENLLNSIINSTDADATLTKVCISNQYQDWNIDVFTK